MKTYTFYLHEGLDTISAFEIDQFDSREDALERARILLTKRPRYNRVVVTEEIVEIARFDRPAEDAPSEALRAAG